MKSFVILQLFLLFTLSVYFRNLSQLYRAHEPSLKTATDGGQIRLQQQLQNISVPEIRHRQKAVICTMVIGEEAYLDEWVDYHLALGFTHIYIYDNSPYSDMKQWGEEKKQAGRPISVKHWPGTAQQMYAYHDCVLNLRETTDTKWVALWDIDEFLLLRKHDTVQEFLSETCEHGAVSINWQLVGSSGWASYSPQQPVTLRFRHKWSHPHDYGKRYYHIKTISRLKDMRLRKSRYMHVHYPSLKKPYTRMDAAGNRLPELSPHNLEPGASNEVAVLVHYRTKSIGEYMQKCLKGRSSQVGMNQEKVDIYKKKCLKGAQLYKGDEVDMDVWQALTYRMPKYTAFETPLSNPVRPSGRWKVAACAMVKDDEAYLDEWVDFHRGLGFENFFLFHTGKSRLEQWATQKGPFVEMKALDDANHDNADQEDESQLWKQCFQSVEKNQMDWWAVLEISDFIVPKSSDSIHNLINRFKRKDGVALQRQLFGTSGRRVYEPRPVTQRFTLREAQPSKHESVIIWNTQRVSNTIKIKPSSSKVTKKKLLGKLGNVVYKTADAAVAHSYWTRSNKEYLVRNLGVEAMLNASAPVNRTYVQEVMDGFVLPEGEVVDTSAWELMLRLNPSYSIYNTWPKR